MIGLPCLPLFEQSLDGEFRKGLTRIGAVDVVMINLILVVSNVCLLVVFSLIFDALQGYGKPSVLHATIVIFLEFFAWGLLTSPTIQVTIN